MLAVTFLPFHAAQVRTTVDTDSMRTASHDVTACVAATLSRQFSSHRVFETDNAILAHHRALALF
jgi:hypothetical protein